MTLLLLISGGFFYWKNNQPIRLLNKNLPPEIKVTKNLANQYKIVNQIDGYEIMIPQEWEGLQEIKYLPPTNQERFSVSSVNIRSKEKNNLGMGIDFFRTERPASLKEMVQKIINTYDLSGELVSQHIEEKETIKIQENEHLGGEYIYFFAGSKPGVFALTGKSKNDIEQIIVGGKW